MLMRPVRAPKGGSGHAVAEGFRDLREGGRAPTPIARQKRRRRSRGFTVTDYIRPFRVR